MLIHRSVPAPALFIACMKPASVWQSDHDLSSAGQRGVAKRGRRRRTPNTLFTNAFAIPPVDFTSIFSVGLHRWCPGGAGVASAPENPRLRVGRVGHVHPDDDGDDTDRDRLQPRSGSASGQASRLTPFSMSRNSFVSVESTTTPATAPLAVHGRPRPTPASDIGDEGCGARRRAWNSTMLRRCRVERARQVR